MFYRLKTKVIQEKVDFTIDEFKLKILNEKPKFLWVYAYSKIKPLYKVHNITDEGVSISSFAWADKTPKFWNWQLFYREMSYSTLSELHTCAKDICPECGADIVTKMSGIACSKCDYWFCY